MDTGYLNGFPRSRSLDRADSRDRRIRLLCVLIDVSPVFAGSIAPRDWRIGIGGGVIAGPEDHADFVRFESWPFGSIRRSSRVIVNYLHSERWNRSAKRIRSHVISRPDVDFREPATSLRPVWAIVHRPEPDCLFERAESASLTSDDRIMFVVPDPDDRHKGVITNHCGRPDPETAAYD